MTEGNKLCAFHLRNNITHDTKIVLAGSLQDACEVANWQFRDITCQGVIETKGHVIEHHENKDMGAKSTPIDPDAELLKHCF